MTLGNGCYTEYDHDNARRLTKMTNKKSNGTVISSWEYGYDDVGNVTSLTDKDSNVTSYTYDDIYRLTCVNYPSGSDFGYEYDEVGNRTKMYEYTSSTITTTYTYDDADELTQYTDGAVTMTFTYASDGCIKAKSDGAESWTYDWDNERRLEAFKENGVAITEYGYNPTGTRRYSSDATLGLTNYSYHGANVLGDHDSSWSLATSYLRLPDCLEILGILDATTGPTPVYYFAKDGQMSTRELLNSSENAVTRYSYDAWGEPTETKLIGDVSTHMQFAAQNYSSRAQVYTDTKGPYEPALAKLLNGTTIHGATRLLECVLPTQSCTWDTDLDHWAFQCANFPSCGCCCEYHTHKCNLVEFSFFWIDPYFTDATGQDRDVRPTLSRWSGIEGDPIPSTQGTYLGIDEDCKRARRTCDYWCELRSDFGTWWGTTANYAPWHAQYSGADIQCYATHASPPGDHDKYCNSSNWFRGGTGDDRRISWCQPYVCYAYLDTAGSDDLGKGTKGGYLSGVQLYCTPAYNGGRGWKWLMEPGAPDFHVSRDTCDNRRWDWRVGDPNP